MILCLDVGNTQIFGGVFLKDELVFHFRKTTSHSLSSDELGVFLRNVLSQNKIEWQSIQSIAVCSVVPQLIHSITNCGLKYFSKRPFLLKPGVKTGLKILYHNPQEVGSDRIANVIGAVQLFPNRNLIVADMGTATTLCAVSKNKDYFGGAILPGVKMSMEALEAKTAKLPTVEIIKPTETVGRSTITSIQSGLYYGGLGALKEICERYSKEYFTDEAPLIVGTGGLAILFKEEGIFDHIVKDLVLKGLYLAYQKNV